MADVTASESGPAAPAIVLERVCRHYSRNRDDDVHALSDVSLTLERGTTTALTGPSGAGKSTLLFLMGGLDRPSSGRVVMLGTPLDTLGDDELADKRGRHVGFVFQSYHLVPTLTVCENVMLPLVPMRVSSLDRRARALHCIESVGLEKRINHLPGELSGGEQQRAALARALANQPEIVLADEPTGNLDPESEEVVLEILMRLAREDGRTVVLTSHSRDVAARCQRIVRVEAGRLVGMTTPASQADPDARAARVGER